MNERISNLAQLAGAYEAELAQELETLFAGNPDILGPLEHQLPILMDSGVSYEQAVSAVRVLTAEPAGSLAFAISEGDPEVIRELIFREGLDGVTPDPEMF